MPYLNCPSCGLVLIVIKPGELVEHCPRCLARRRKLVDLFVSASPRGKEPQRSAQAARAGSARSEQ